jgi:hypothetical protein
MASTSLTGLFQVHPSEALIKLAIQRFTCLSEKKLQRRKRGQAAEGVTSKPVLLSAFGCRVCPTAAAV